MLSIYILTVHTFMTWNSFTSLSVFPRFIDLDPVCLPFISLKSGCILVTPLDHQVKISKL
jgi:hypothetical protein